MRKPSGRNTTSYPLELTVDSADNVSKIHVVLREPVMKITRNNIVSAGLNLRVLVSIRDKKEYPFLQQGEFKLMFNDTVLDVQENNGLLESLYFFCNPNSELIKLLLGKTDKGDIKIVYRFSEFDFSLKENISYKGSKTITTILQNVLKENTTYQFLDEKEFILKKFDTEKENSIKAKGGSRIILRGENFQLLNNKPAISSLSLATHSANLTLNVQPVYSSVSLLAQFNIETKKQYPKIDDPSHNYFLDYERSGFYWIRPFFQVQVPENGTGIGDSPFVFEVKNIGVGADGNAALEGEFLLTIKTLINPEWTKDLNREAKKKLIKRIKTEFKIELPYLNAEGIKNTTYLNSTTSNTTGQVTKLTFNVSNQWVRLLYAALSTPTLKNEHRPKLNIRYYFDAMVRKKPVSVYLVSGALSTAMLSTSFSKKSEAHSRGIADSVANSRRSKRRATGLNTISSTGVANWGKLTAVQQPNKITANSAVLDLEKKKEYTYQRYLFTHNEELVFNCDAFGDYYLLNHEETISTIGCSEPMRLGQIKTKLFEEIVELRHLKYTVYKSMVMPQLFIIVPSRYIISRRLEAPEMYAPEVALHGAVDIENIVGSRCLINFNLEPDLSFFERKLIEHRLNDFTAHTPIINYSTEFPGEENLNWNLSGTILEENSYTIYGSVINGVLETNIVNAQLCKSLLETGGLTGAYSKKITEDIMFISEVRLDLDYLNAPWNGEGVAIEKDGDELILSNQLESPIHVNRLESIDFKSDEIVQVQKGISPQTFIRIPYGGELLQFIPVFSIQTDQVALNENYSYIEDLFQQIICFDMFSNKDIGTLLEVYVGCRNHPPFSKLDFSDGSFEKATSLLVPLSEIVSSQDFGYFIKYVTPEGAVLESEWMIHDFSSVGNIININSSIIN